MYVMSSELACIAADASTPGNWIKPHYALSGPHCAPGSQTQQIDKEKRLMYSSLDN